MAKKPRPDPVEYVREADVYEPGTVVSFPLGSPEDKAWTERWRRERLDSESSET
jgi:hypothetical protein